MGALDKIFAKAATNENKSAVTASDHRVENAQKSAQSKDGATVAGNLEKKKGDSEAVLSRRRFLKKGALATATIVTGSLFRSGVASAVERKEGVQELINKFTQKINSEADKVPKLNEQSAQDLPTQSMYNNLNYILGKLAKNRNALDEKTYRLFAQLTVTKNEEFRNVVKALVNRFAEFGFYFNFCNKVIKDKQTGAESDLFIPGKLERRELKEMKGVRRIFPEAAKYYAQVFVMDDEKFDLEGSTMTIGELPVINKRMINESYKDRIEKEIPHNALWSDSQVKDLIRFVEANELGHHLLHSLYKFPASRRDLSWDDFQSVQKNNKRVVNSGEVNEFISDAFSIQDEPRMGLIFLTNNLLKTKFLSGAEGKSKKYKPGDYGYSQFFHLNELKRVLGRENLDDEIAKWGESYKTFASKKEKDNFLFEKVRQILSELDADSISSLQESFAKEADNMLERIRRE